MYRIVAAAIASLLLAADAVRAGEELLPRPDAIEPAVRFWTRVYTEVDSGGGLIHDSEHLDVVYEAVRLPSGSSHRAQERRTEKIKQRYRDILRQLAEGKRSGLTAEQARVLERWPEGVSNATLLAAANRLRFQLGQADKFRAGLIRAGAWSDYIEGVLAERGVPIELAALPHVESSYNPKAYSRVGAAGLWQFTRSTGHRYLTIDRVIDERLDPYKATVAAARLLSDNHRTTGSWPLAITAYNHGAAGMRRAAHKLGTRDIATVIRKYKSRTFGFASRNFYTSFLAAVDVDRDAERYFGPLPIAQPERFDTVRIDHYYRIDTLERALGLRAAVLEEHNPALRPAVWNGSKFVPPGLELRVPLGSVPEPELVLAGIPASEREQGQHRDRFHKVGRGETLSVIARRYGVREQELVALNNLRNRHSIRAGQVLVLPDGPGGAVVARSEPPADGIYDVRSGDTLSRIATRFGVSEQSLMSWNGLRDRNLIAVGQRLIVTASVGPAVASRAEAATARAEAATARAEAATARAEAATARADTATVPQPGSGPPSGPEPAAPQPSDEPVPDPAAPEPSPTVIAVRTLPDPVELVAEPSEVAVIQVTATPSEARPIAADRRAPAPDPSDYAVSADERVTVQGDETLGHYADWLEVRASTLRRLNGMKYDTPLVIGKRKRLDFSRVSPDEFERRRLEYHRSLQEEFFAAFQVTGTETYVLQQGDSLWLLAQRRFQLPVWLLSQYNPDLDFGALQAGTRMVIPQVEPFEG